jgi:uncharacterized protein
MLPIPGRCKKLFSPPATFESQRTQRGEFVCRNGEKTLFLSLDIEMDQPYFAAPAALLDRIKLEFGNNKGYVFIDEIQRKENARLLLKGIYDKELPRKFSGSVELKEKIHESLTGRKRIFELNFRSLPLFLL